MNRKNRITEELILISDLKSKKKGNFIIPMESLSDISLTDENDTIIAPAAKSQLNINN